MYKAEVYTMEDFKKQAKKTEKKEWLKSKWNSFKDFVIDNKEVLFIVGPVAISAVTFVGKTTVKQINLRKEQNLKDLYCYDRSLGHYWKLKRELTNKEWVEIDQRKRNGERLADILEEFKVLK